MQAHNNNEHTHIATASKTAHKQKGILLFSSPLALLVSATFELATATATLHRFCRPSGPEISSAESPTRQRNRKEGPRETFEEKLSHSLSLFLSYGCIGHLARSIEPIARAPLRSRSVAASHPSIGPKVYLSIKFGPCARAAPADRSNVRPNAMAAHTLNGFLPTTAAAAAVAAPMLLVDFRSAFGRMNERPLVIGSVRSLAFGRTGSSARAPAARLSFFTKLYPVRTHFRWASVVCFGRKIGKFSKLFARLLSSALLCTTAAH